MDKILLSAVVFIGLLALLTGALFTGNYSIIVVNNQTQFSNGTGGNVSVITGGSSNGFEPFPVCSFSGNWILAFPELAVCMGSMIGWLIGFMFTSSDVAWLNVIFIAVGAVILYRIIRILKPTGGS